GILAMWKAPEASDWSMSTALFTQDSVGPSAEVHERMPLVLPPDAEKAWLDPALTDAAQAMALARNNAVTDVAHHRVGPQVNASKSEGESLIQPVDDADAA